MDLSVFVFSSESLRIMAQENLGKNELKTYNSLSFSLSAFSATIRWSMQS